MRAFNRADVSCPFESIEPFSIHSIYHHQSDPHSQSRRVFLSSFGVSNQSGVFSANINFALLILSKSLKHSYCSQISIALFSYSFNPSNLNFYNNRSEGFQPPRMIPLLRWLCRSCPRVDPGFTVTAAEGGGRWMVLEASPTLDLNGDRSSCWKSNFMSPEPKLGQCRSSLNRKSRVILIVKVS